MRIREKLAIVGKIVSGVAQGSSLEFPLLFVIYISETFHTGFYSHKQWYADVNFFDITNPERDSRLLNEDLQSLSRYSRETNLKIKSDTTFFYLVKNAKEET